MKDVSGAVQLLERAQYELLPLIMQRLMGNRRMRGHGVADVPLERRRMLRQLYCNARDHAARRCQLAAAARKEEAGSEAALVGTAVGNCACDSRVFILEAILL
jgi:hypothetical protein